MAKNTDETTPETPEEPGVEQQAAGTEPEQAVEAPEPEAGQSAEEPGVEEQAAGTEPEQAVEAPEPEAGQRAETKPTAASAPPVAEPQEQLSPKERRRRSRSTHSGTARPQRTPEERHTERAEQRLAKARKRRARRAQERAKAAERRASAPAPEPLAPVHAQVKGAPKARLGTVISDRAAKTITVRIDVARRHRRYEKIVRSSTTLHAHDENNEAHVGDLVRVVESRPLSRTKRWRLVDVLERAR
jgi:small subunit ribosomal protein S17